jgi:hypothetical protein
MDVNKTSVDDFYTGSGSVSGTSAPIIAPAYAHEAYKGVMVRAAVTNSAPIFVGPSTVSAATGYRLTPGEELLVPVNDPSKVYVVGTPGDGFSWLAV